MLPKQKEIEVPLLEALAEIGGQGKARDIYPLVTKRFPTIRDEDLVEALPSGGNKWTNRIQWVRQRLIDKGEIYSPSRGIWAITDKGRRRVEAKEPPPPSPPNFVELYEDYETSFRSQLLEKLNELNARQFELFARKLLQAYGFVEVNVTSVSSDGGIDGYGKLRLGLATMNVAFQCKRWQGNVGRPEVDKFRGAIQGEFEQGVFFVTSDFTPHAREASLKRGAVPIILLNGESIVELMIQKGIGVERVPLYMYYERSTDFLEEE
ncbi:MAG: restriction endonuclease [Candidatus Bathyarchaeota archaeon]|nr:restriction endonuclease [Candidatus Bathyarchaeota archaeon]MDH5688994.1 restriction endonuclease [Candidatus Bathyarchaeota archaeon]